METKTIINKQWTLKMRDWLIGAGMAVGAAVVAVVYESVQAGGLEFNLQAIKVAAISAFVAYIGKNFTEKSKKITTEPIEEK